MSTILRFDLLWTILVVVLQAFILLTLCLFVLRKLQILKIPYAGMEYSQLIVSASLIFGVFFISTSDTGALFQTFKTFQNANEKVFSNTLAKFSQFFLVVVFFEILYFLLIILIVKALPGFRKVIREVGVGNLPLSILLAVIAICFAIVLQFCSKEVIEYLVPKYVIFN